MSYFSLHKITDENKIPFSETEYSRFKFGDKDIARKFGTALGKAFAEQLGYGKRQIVVCSSPYCFIPTATFAMKDYFVRALNEHLVKHDCNVVQEAKIHRTNSYNEDYGALSHEERMNLIGGDHFHIDASFVEGKAVIFLDDIRITGSHERVIQKMFETFALESRMFAHQFVYFASLENTDIHPRIENKLNYAYVTKLLDLDKVIKNNNFILNTRVVKFILAAPHIDFVPFINYQRMSLIKTIYHSAVGNSYHLVEEYAQNFNYLKNIANGTRP